MEKNEGVHLSDWQVDIEELAIALENCSMAELEAIWQATLVDHSRIIACIQFIEDTIKLRNLTLNHQKTQERQNNTPGI